MKMKAVLAAVLVIAMAFAFVVPADTDDAAISIHASSHNVTLDAGTGGTIKLVYTSDVSKPLTITVTDTATGLSDKYTYAIDATGTDAKTIDVPVGPGSGTKVLNFSFSDPSIKEFSVNVKYDAGIWSNWTIYAVIIAIVILVAALVLFKSRAPKAKNTLTFEQVEAMKQAERAEASQPKAEKKTSGGSTERQRYLASKKKKE